jgi:signal transduction histidine kinase/ligand-binding sensor domain-containing protein
MKDKFGQGNRVGENHRFKAIGALLRACTGILMAHFLLLISHSANAQGLPLIRNYTATEYGGHNRNYDIAIGQDGTVFVANFEGLLYYDRVRWRMIHTPEINRITMVYCDKKNTIWVGGYNYFARLRKSANGELYMQKIGQKNSGDENGQEQKAPFKGEVMEMFEDQSTAKLQFVATDNNIYEIDETDEDLPTVSVKKRAKTNSRSGVDMGAVALQALEDNSDNSALDDITQIESLDGGLWVKVKKNHGLVICDNHGRELYTISEANGLCSNQVKWVAYDGHGLLWGATFHGIFAIEVPSVYSYFLPKDGFAGEVHAITAFDGKIYVGSTNGLYVIEQSQSAGSTVRGGKVPSSPQCRRIAEINNICWTLCEGNDGLLVASSSGIYKIAHGGSVSRLTTNSTSSMYVEKQGFGNGRTKTDDKIYAGEPDGVYCYQAGKVEKVCSLPLVTEIRKNAQGELWFKNVHGETKGRAPGRKAEPLDDLARNLLMPLSDIDVKAQYRHDNQIWVGGDEILAIIDTDKRDLARLTDCRTVRFRSVIMGTDSVLWGGYGEQPKELPELGSNEGHLHFYYALDYAPLSGKTLYRYRLDNSKWSVWSEKQDMEFPNLSYGSFVLSVQAKLANGELSEVATVDFSIAPPLLRRWYMMGLYLVIMAYLFYLLFRYRLKRLQKEKIKLENIVKERTSEVVKQKDEIEEKSRSLEKALEELGNAQHELIRQEKMATVGKLTEGLIDRILNPMNYIINFSKMSNDLLKDLKANIDNNKECIDKEDYEDTLDVLDMLTQNLESVDQYGQNTTRTLKAMEEMLKDRSGGYVDMDWLPVLQQNEKMLATYFAKEKEQYHIKTTFSLPNRAMPLHGNPEMLSKTVMSLLGNAVYAVIKKAEKTLSGMPQSNYAPEISLTVTLASRKGSGKSYVLKIRDNGIGIGEKTINKIFDPFFTTKTTSEAAGVGLYLSREIVQNHGGDISVASVKDEYTEFTITIPVASGQNKSEKTINEN